MEKVFLKKGAIEITSSIARIGSSSYPIRSIGSVRTVEKRTSYRGPGTFGAILGIIFLNTEAAVVGFLAFVAGVVMFFIPPLVEHQLILRTSSEDQQVLQTKNQGLIGEVRKALESAIAYRGEIGSGEGPNG